MAQVARSRRRNLVLLVAGVLLFLIFHRTYAPGSLRQTGGPSTADHGRFWVKFHDILKVTAPDCNSPKRLEDHPTAIGFKPDEADSVTLPEHIVVEEEDKEKLKKAHSHFMSLLSAPNAPRLAYKPRTRGIVSTAGGSFLPVVVTSLHMLRQTGSDLPVEIFIADPSEHDEYICNSLFPSLNARCITLSEILDHSPLAAGLKKYQFKIFSLLFSSFEEVMFLDADAFPMHDPGRLFAAEPFSSHGLVTWPDFWQVTYHKSFFENHVAAHSPKVSRTPLPSLKSHAKMLLLSAYYNFYGPSHYYPLLSQGHPGEGDKETFLAPARILNLPFYAVSTGPGVFGYKKPDGGWEGGVIMQADPIWDSKLQKDQSFGWGGKPNAPPNSFITCHANLPKLEPVRVFGDKGLAWTEDNKPKRMWGPAEEMIGRVGHDIEKDLWKALASTACVLEGKYKPWDGKPKLCEKIMNFISDMNGK
ncbi:predicted protein [Uncinocarpus reesii 1704]|uniref:Alpha-1,2-mannosyltransferase n=1 Tax=Uncinocarpus reesii (strain UAMH 1704) TaxID=336963 RepID=C4JQ56_UNCRE|nr:uncharacterized protein UREG_03289 [Uncinocarpus reesii 1704]EEP78443.1 predicted protein [Uncinocarpus reesii 1704]